MITELIKNKLVIVNIMLNFCMLLDLLPFSKLKLRLVERPYKVSLMTNVVSQIFGGGEPCVSNFLGLSLNPAFNA